MKFTIDIDEFRLENDDETTLSTQLQKEIVSDLISKVRKLIEEKTESISEKYLLPQIDSLVNEGIQNKIKQVVEEGRIEYRNSKVAKGDDGLCSIEDVVRYNVLESYRGSDFETVIRKFAEKFSVELKERYDLAFASQIVNKLSEKGLLKDDALKALIQ